MPSNQAQVAAAPGPGIRQSNYSFKATEYQSYDSGVGDGGSEVVARFEDKLYITNGEADRIDIFDIATGALLRSIDLTAVPGYDGVNSVAVSGAGIAVAVERDPAVHNNGVVAVFDLAGGATPTHVIEVGNLPDMLTYSKDGTQIFVANEGEAHDDGDPLGSISVIDVATMTAQTFDFSAFDSMVQDLRDAGVRIFPGKVPSTDFEPEYIAEGADGRLYITLQENNAVAVFDPATMQFDDILPLGTVDHSVDGFGIDPSDKDDAINIRTIPVEGMRMPDAIATVERANGTTLFLTANEGDARKEDERIGKLDLDATAFPDAATLQENENLGRLNVSTIDGDIDGDGDFDALYSYGTRSFTIFNEKGKVLFDSGDDFETIIATKRPPNAFNNDDFPTETNPGIIDENRSDNKGPEPEAIATGVIDGRTYAFIGLERDSGIMIYDITKPKDSFFVHYIDGHGLGHISPEVITFISADESETGQAQIAVAYEVSGTAAIFDLVLGQRIVGTPNDDTITGTTADDAIYGMNGADTLIGDAGADHIEGNNGADILSGGAGFDVLHGGRGRDSIDGGIGHDSMTGGKGADVFIFEEGDGQDNITDFQNWDRIDLSAVASSINDLTITMLGADDYEIEYGSSGDMITVTNFGSPFTIDADTFIF
jgi:Ca2+-binding RTX toxin-like protein